ncbi:hypothetical protein ACFQDE_21755 [Deinococcus caeni]
MFQAQAPAAQRGAVEGALFQRGGVLGREAALQAIEWPEGDWPTLAQGGHHPAAQAQLPALPPHPWPDVPARDDFSGPQLRAEWMTLRAPPEVLGVSLAEGAACACAARSP